MAPPTGTLENPPPASSSSSMSSSANLSDTLAWLSLPNACPLCVVALDADTGRPIQANSTFESTLGPLYKFSSWEFANAACQDTEGDVVQSDSGGSTDGDDDDVDGRSQHKVNRTKFRAAIDSVRTGKAGTARVRNIEMLTMGNEAGLPIRRYFDWSVGSVEANNEGGAGQNGSGGSKVVVLYGDPVTPTEASGRERDSELIDFFQNAPIALHWLNSDGTVLWCNQTELNVLGYTAEEYIGQPIMNFCPDEQELVLEIFKQLGSGNAIRDVPVRFRTKDGKLIHLLIDSNVAYKRDGSFGHTRCFIRDDTGRKVRDARSALLLEEMKRSLRMLDGFMSKTLHHVMTPLHALQGACDIVSDRLRRNDETDGNAPTEDGGEMSSIGLLEAASDTIANTTRMIGDVSDLARFDQGAVLCTHPSWVDLREVGIEAMDRIPDDMLPPDASVDVQLEVQGGGQASIWTDQAALLRVLGHLMENSVREVVASKAPAKGEKKKHVTLRIKFRGGRTSKYRGVTFELEDNGPGLPVSVSPAEQGTMAGPGADAKAPDGAAKTTAPPAGKSGAGNFGKAKDAFHRYTGEAVSAEGADFEKLEAARAKSEDNVKGRRRNGMGVGLPLTHHLVSALGGDLRFYSVPGSGARLFFTIPIEEGSSDGPSGGSSNIQTKAETISKFSSSSGDAAVDMDAVATVDATATAEGRPAASKRGSYGSVHSDTSHSKRRRISRDADFSTFIEDESTPSDSDATSLSVVKEVKPKPSPVSVAKSGVKATMQTSVLVVEDTKMCAKVIMMQLRKMNCSPDWAENGQIAVDMLKEAATGMYDMVLMDLRMPVMDGLTATKVIREELKLTTLPIIALTGEVSDDIAKQCEEIGFDEFCSKPLKKPKLQELVKKYTGLCEDAQ